MRSVLGAVKLRRWSINRTGINDEGVHAMNGSGEAFDLVLVRQNVVTMPTTRP